MTVQQSNTNALVATIVKMGLRHVVICPGSRNAPLVMALARHPDLHCHSSVDERSAAFVAMGMAKSLQQPVAVCCTSGTALLNFYPAVAEAWYMQIPLLLISADRPPELIDRWDGQAIHQKGVFGPHIKASFEASGAEDRFIQCGAEAMRLCNSGIKGPVHINVPLSEPLYTEAGTVFKYPDIDIQVKTGSAGTGYRGFSLGSRLAGKRRILVLCGAGKSDKQVRGLLKRLSQSKHILVLGDIISGYHAVSEMSQWEALLLGATDEIKDTLVPDLLITTGKMLLNKPLKALLKTHKPSEHWHVAENGYCADPFYTNPLVLAEPEHVFFTELLNSESVTGDETYLENWRALDKGRRNKAQIAVAEQQFGEFSALRAVLKSQTAEHLVLHAANSMSIRLLAYSADLIQESWQVHCNRGVSGIDGCTSTAMGMALLSNNPHLLITGDLAFFYDASAFLMGERPENLKIVVLNNNGGGIFMQIEGPASMPEANPYLITPHHLSARHLAAQHSISYFSAGSEIDFAHALAGFNAAKGLSILEIFTDIQTNTDIFKQFKTIPI